VEGAGDGDGDGEEGCEVDGLAVEPPLLLELELELVPADPDELVEPELLLLGLGRRLGRAPTDARLGAFGPRSTFTFSAAAGPEESPSPPVALPTPNATANSRTARPAAATATRRVFICIPAYEASSS
jgi:hypothetical protein